MHIQRILYVAFSILLVYGLSSSFAQDRSQAKSKSNSSLDSSKVQKRSVNNGNLILEDIPPIPPSLKQRLQQYQNVRSAPVRAWNKEGTSLYISTRFADVSQLHRVDHPGGARHQLSFFKEPIGSVARQPKGDLLAFTMDAGGNEYAQIFLFNPKTSTYQMISDGESRNGAIQWSQDGKSLAFQSTRRGERNDIWMMQIGQPDQAHLVLESPDGTWWGAVDFSSDGKHLLVLNYVSIAHTQVYQVDLKTKEKTLLAGSNSKPYQAYPLSYDQKNRGIYMTSNQKGEFARLVYLDLKTKEQKELTQNLPWDVKGFAMSPQRDRIAFTVNAGGIYDLYLMNPQNHQMKKVSGLPPGIIGGLTFNPNGRQLAFTLNTAQTPSDTYVIDLHDDLLSHGQPVRWTFSEVGGLSTHTFSIPELIHYPTFDQVNNQARQIPAFVYKPKTSKKTSVPLKKYPVVITIHGGPESQFKPAFRGMYQFWLKELGIAIIAPNVRGSSGYGNTYVNLDNGFKREDSVKDIGALLDWIQTQPDLDASRVAVFGGSYGGYMVLASAVHYSKRLKAAVDIVGISNFVTFLKNTKDYRRDLRRVEYGDERNEKMKAFLNQISPNQHVDQITVPLLVVQGENDPRVPVSEATQIVKALRQANRKVWYMNALNEGHGYRKKENRDVYQEVVALFFKQFLLP